MNKEKIDIYLYQVSLTYSHKNASASSMKSSKPFRDFLAQSNNWCILVTACDPRGATSPPVINA